jgi:UPF0755 protein
MKKLLLFVSLFVIFIALSAVITMGFAFYWFSAPGPLTQEKVVNIPPGTGFKAITQQLVIEQVVDYSLPFQALVLWHGKQTDFKAGEYQFKPAISPRQVMEMLVEGKSIIHAITIPEGLTTQEILAILMADERLTGAMPVGIAEGSLMPNTYHFYRGEPRLAIVERMQASLRKSLEELWAHRAPDLPVKTPAEVITLAAVVEEETGVPEERGRVAAVFINRLRKNMPLQSDPTVVYGIELEDGPMNRPLLRTDLARDHPYNTYLYRGLPAGPICHPGHAAIAAVLNPPDTDELYFVATGTGGHFFASNLRDHNANVARYKAALRKQRGQ